MKRYYSTFLHVVFNIKSFIKYISTNNRFKKLGYYFSHLKLNYYNNLIYVYIFFYDKNKIERYKMNKIARFFFLRKKGNNLMLNGFKKKVWLNNPQIKWSFLKKSSLITQQLYLFMFFFGFNLNTLVLESPQVVFKKWLRIIGYRPW